MVQVRVIDLPTRVRGVTAMDGNGDYSVYINAGMSIEQQQKTYNHELTHIGMGHFDDPRSLKEREKEANEGKEITIRELEYPGI